MGRGEGPQTVKAMSETREHTGIFRTVWFWLLLVATAAMVFLYYFYPNLGIGPEQPIPFSHRLHAGVKQIDCRFCHSYVERSRNAGLPAMEKCFYCHQYIIPAHPVIVNLKQRYETNNPVRWVRLFYLPDHVKFNHQPHVKWAGLDCAECHGAVKEADRLDRNKFQMKFCIDCHRQMDAQLDCWLACHH